MLPPSSRSLPHPDPTDPPTVASGLRKRRIRREREARISDGSEGISAMMRSVHSKLRGFGAGGFPGGATWDEENKACFGEMRWVSKGARYKMLQPERTKKIIKEKKKMEDPKCSSL